MIKFIISYVGSKAYWVKFLKEKYMDSNIVEPFCGSAVLSANLAKHCVLNDADPYIYKILSEFDTLIVPEEFTKEDYFKVRKQTDWYKYIYCLQKLSFSGVFRYSKNGYNVPIKSDEPIHVRENYLEAKKRWQDLSPVVLNKQYYELNEYIKKDTVLILDPPYENGKASYNQAFDFHFYWEYVRLNENICKTIILFDYACNLPFESRHTKKIRVNGSKPGNIEAMHIFQDSLKEGQAGEDFFYELNKDTLERLDGLKNDFRIIKTGDNIELKSDYYSVEKTPNFFMETVSVLSDNKQGGPFQALANGNKYYVYFFVKDKVMYIFETEKLVNRLNEIKDNYEDCQIPNKNHITIGKKIPRDVLKDIYKERIITSKKTIADF